MTLAIESVPVPLRVDEHGAIRVGNTRVTLDTVIDVFRLGSTPEQIVQQFPSLDLGEVYATIAFYLRNRDQVDAYLATRRADGDRLRREIEGRFDPTGLRERLLARRDAKPPP